MLMQDPCTNVQRCDMTIIHLYRCRIAKGKLVFGLLLQYIIIFLIFFSMRLLMLSIKEPRQNIIKKKKNRDGQSLLSAQKEWRGKVGGLARQFIKVHVGSEDLLELYVERSWTARPCANSDWLRVWLHFRCLPSRVRCLNLQLWSESVQLK